MLGSYKISQLLLSLDEAYTNRRGWSDCRFYPTFHCQSPKEVKWVIEEALPYLKQKRFIDHEEIVKIVPYDITAHDIFFHNFFELAQSNKESAKTLAELCGLRNLWSLIDETMSIQQFAKVIKYRKYEDLKIEYEWDLIHNTCIKVKLLKRGKDWINTNKKKMVQLTTRVPEKERDFTTIDNLEDELETISFDTGSGELNFSHSNKKVRFKKGTKMYDLLKVLWRNPNQDLDIDDLADELRTTPTEKVDVLKRAYNIKKKLRKQYVDTNFLTINSNEGKIRVAPYGVFDPIRPTKWL